MAQVQTESPLAVFQVRPQLLQHGKKTHSLARTDLLTLGVQVVAEGGETNMHAHADSDAVWLVLNGRARFYGQDEQAVEIGRFEGLVIPRGVPYWFESASEENLVILRFGAKAQGGPTGRIDYSERKYSVGDEQDSRPRFPAVVLEGKYFGD